MSTPWTTETKRLDKLWRRMRCRFFRADLKRLIEGLWRPDWSILDVGCGSGILYQHLRKEIRPYYFGVDFTQEFIDLCKNRYPRGNFSIDNALALSHCSNSVEIVNNTALLQHVKYWYQALQEMVRVAKLYVVTVTRVHLEPTEESPATKILTWRFNQWELLAEMRKYGCVEWTWTTSTMGKKDKIMLFLLRKDFISSSRNKLSIPAE